MDQLDKKMPRSKGILGDLLADLSNTAPKDIDPENFGAESLSFQDTYYDDEEQEQSETEFDGREHYVKVDRGSLRVKSGMEIEDEKYQGKKTSRLSLYEEDEYEQENQEENEEEQEPEDDEVASKEENDDVDGHDNDKNDDDEEQSIIQKELETLKQQESVMVSQVASGVQNDAEKGKHVRSQMALFDHFLDARIRLQKAVSVANTFPKHESYSSLYSNLQDQYGSSDIQQELAQSSNVLTGLIHDLLTIRHTLIEKNEIIPDSITKDIPETFPKKRSFEEMDNKEIILESVWQDIQLMDISFQPFSNHIIEKWNNKVQMASAGSALASKKFKAINQSVMNQINQVLQDKERLLKRCRLRRSQFQVIGEESSVQLNGEIGEQNECNESNTEQQQDRYDEELFDDMDFYQMMLKEFIESRMGDGDDPVSLGLKMVQLRQLQEQQKKKKKKAVDTKASKGRKIRYHVHEKLVNFMAPQPKGTWHDDMREQLFKNLFGAADEHSSQNELGIETQTKTDSLNGSRRLEAQDGFTILVG